ncbi:MAG: DUF3093 domain-containing protein [Jatrophihabitantaceae bacterium]
MTDPSTHQSRPATQQAGYFERLRTPWWWYLGAVGVSVLLGLEFAVAISGWIAWVPFAILLPASLLVVRRLSSGSVAVDGATLRAGERSLALAETEQVIDLSPTELRRLVGRHSDPLAYTYIRSWIGPGVQLVLRQPGHPQSGDPQSAERFPEPYWVVSTRHPARLLAAIRAAAESPSPTQP